MPTCTLWGIDCRTGRAYASYARAPEPDDIIRICRSLNDAGARYVLIGGFALIAHGATRFTKRSDRRQTLFCVSPSFIVAPMAAVLYIRRNCNAGARRRVTFPPRLARLS